MVESIVLKSLITKQMQKQKHRFFNSQSLGNMETHETSQSAVQLTRGHHWKFYSNDFTPGYLEKKGYISKIYGL